MLYYIGWIGKLPMGGGYQPSIWNGPIEIEPIRPSCFPLHLSLFLELELEISLRVYIQHTLKCSI